jgi:hypothetical protein
MAGAATVDDDDDDEDDTDSMVCSSTLRFATRAA